MGTLQVPFCHIILACWPKDLDNQPSLSPAPHLQERWNSCIIQTVSNETQMMWKDPKWPWATWETLAVKGNKYNVEKVPQIAHFPHPALPGFQGKVSLNTLSCREGIPGIWASISHSSCSHAFPKIIVWQTQLVFKIKIMYRGKCMGMPAWVIARFISIWSCLQHQLLPGPGLHCV